MSSFKSNERKSDTEFAEIITEIENVYNKYVFCHKEDILTSHGSFTKKSVPTYSHSGLSRVPTKLISILILRK